MPPINNSTSTDTNIIEISHADVPKLFSLAEEFFDKSELGVKFNPAYFALSMSQLIAIGAGAAFALEDYSGAIGGFLFTDKGTGQRVADEWFFYIRPENRKGWTGVKLFKRFERWAKENGATRLITGSLPNRRLNTLYDRLGYKHLETRFVKIFNE